VRDHRMRPRAVKGTACKPLGREDFASSRPLLARPTTLTPGTILEEETKTMMKMTKTRHLIPTLRVDRSPVKENAEVLSQLKTPKFL